MNNKRQIKKLLIFRENLARKTFLYGVLLFLTAVITSTFLILTKLDVDIHRTVVSYSEIYGLRPFWGFLSWVGEDHIQAFVCLVMGIFYYKKSCYRMSRIWYLSIPIFLASGIFVQVLKHIFGRPRPKMLPEYDFLWFELGSKFHSFPSGHTLTTFAWLACLLPFYPKKIQALFVVCAAFIGFSRVGVGAHYLSDVLCAAVVGYVFGMVLREKFKLNKSVR